MTNLTLPTSIRCVKALLVMVPPLPPPLLFGGEDDAHSTNANSSPTALAHTICWTLKAPTLSDGFAGSKDGKGGGGINDGDASSGSQELDCAQDWDGPSPPSPSGSAMAMKVAGK